MLVGFLKNCFGQRFGGRQSEVQAERRLERSRNGTTAAVPLTEAQRGCVFSFPSATSAREAVAERALVAVVPVNPAI